jgi:hypothetical protein
LVEDFRSLSSVKPGRGDTIIFWSHKWKFNDSLVTLSEKFPRLFFYVLDQHMSVADYYEVVDRINLFYLPLSTEAF